MAWSSIIWDPTPGGNVEHIAEHDLAPEDVDYESASTSQSTGRPCVFGYAPDGRYIIVVYEEIDDDTVIPWTEYEVDVP